MTGPLMALLFGVAAGIALIVTVSLLAKAFLIVGTPCEAVVFSGRKRTAADGTSVGYRVLVGGRAFRIPLLEKVDRMSLRLIPVELQLANAYSRGGIRLKIHAIANVKISSDPAIIGNAIERFLGRDSNAIAKVARETLEGHLRGVLANLTPEEVNEDRLKFATTLVDEAEGDFRKLGLHLDTLKVQNVADDSNYLASIGRARIAAALRDAEVAESGATAEAEQREAESGRAGDVAGQHADSAIAEKENEFRRLKAELEAEAKSAEETAQQAALRDRAQAEQKLQTVRRTLEETRLQAEQVLPAEAQKEAATLAARGAAATIEENGRAAAEVLRLLNAAWAEAGSDARDIVVLQNLEPILRATVDRVKQLKVGETHLVDGGDGRAVASFVASFPAAVRGVLDEVGRTTGIDVAGVLRQEVRK